MTQRLAPGLELYGYAFVNSDGTFAFGTPTLTMIKGSAGNYIIQPADHFAQADLMAIAISAEGIPFLPSLTYGLGPTGDGVQVLVYNTSPTPAVLADGSFWFYLYTTGNTKRTTSVP